MSPCHLLAIRFVTLSPMYDLTFKDAIKLTGKTKRTIQRYLSSGKLTYIDSPNGSRLFNRLELLQTVGVVAPTGNGEFLALAKEQLAATQLNNELLSEVLRTLKSERQQLDVLFKCNNNVTGR